MKKNTMFFSFLCATSLIHATVLFDTVVQTPDGFKEIQALNVEDQVIAVDANFAQHSKSITTIAEQELENYVEITMDNDVIMQVSRDQRLFIPYKWIQADQLSLGDVLLTKDSKFVRIKSICVKQEHVKVYVITVADYENFFASKNSVLIHNGPIAGAIGYWVTKTLCYGTAVAAVSTAIVTTGGFAGAAAVTAATTIATSGATTSAAVVGGLIVKAGFASEAVVATTAVVSTAGGLTGTVAAIESASTVVWGVLTLCPFLP